MAQIIKTEAKAEITSPAAKVFDFFKYNLTSFVHVFPQVFKSAQLVEGEEGQVGNVKVMEYVLGKTMTAKLRTEEINDQERYITMRILEGDILQLYSNFTVKISITDGCVNWGFEFEKNNDSVPNPDIYAKLATKVTKVLDLYLVNN